MNRCVCPPLEIPVDPDEVDRFDLVFYGVDHSGPSYQARVFHPIVPHTRTVVLDSAAQQLLRGAEVTVVAVAVDISGAQPQESDALSFERIRLLSYVD